MNHSFIGIFSDFYFIFLRLILERNQCSAFSFHFPKVLTLKWKIRLFSIFLLFAVCNSHFSGMLDDRFSRKRNHKFHFKNEASIQFSSQIAISHLIFSFRQNSRFCVNKLQISISSE